MSERLQQNGSERESNHEALERQAHERSKQLRELVERRAEASHEKAPDAHEAEKEAHEAARVAEKERNDKEKHTTAPAERRKERLVRNKKTLDASFNREMKEVRTHMSAPSRVFSKVIHNKAVDRTSEVVGNTIARPNAILAGSLAALILTTGLYTWAKNNGYPLSGFETIGAFIIGWLIGIIIDFVRITITGRS
jgi:hypothetical protein